MVDDSTAQTQTDSSQISDPYVIYQLRKPNQRGTAVIPRVVPNTHAPAFSPANYRFARVWTAHDNTAVSPSALLHVPRSFEYAGSLGSESSLWSDTSSWVSVSSLRTTPSEARAPLLHSNHTPISAASFFNSDLETHRLRSSFRASSSRRSDIDSPIANDFRYPPALSESLSEDAVIDDLLSLRKPQFPHLRNHSSLQNPRDHSAPYRQSSRRNNNRSSQSRHRSDPRSNPSRNSLIPTLTRKRRSLWQWLFCTNKAAMSTTVPSVTISQTATAVRRRIQPVNSSPRAQHPQSDPTYNPRATTLGSRDRVPKADKDFLDRTQKAPDASDPKKKATRKRHPSFEIRRGRPSSASKSGRSISWNFMPRGFLGRDKHVHKETKEKKKRNSKPKDKPRQMPPEEPKEPRKLHRLIFQRPSSRKARDAEKEQPRNKKRSTQAQNEKQPNTKLRKESHKPLQSRTGASPEDRPREDRPRKSSKPLLDAITGGGAPQPKSVVPSLREKQANGNSSQTQRMRSTGSSDPVTSRISSDLSTTTYGRTSESSSSRSASNRGRQRYKPPTHELDPAAQGVSSDVSSHVSGTVGKTSPTAMTPDQNAETASLSSPEIRGIDPNIMSRDSPHRTPLFAYPSTSSGSGGFSESIAWENSLAEYPDYTTAFGNFSSTAPELIAMMDPVARAKEKNRVRSAGGPLSYLMKQHEIDGDANTESSGLTSLADESVSTHKTFSVVGEEYQFRSQLPSGLEGRAQGKVAKPPKSLETEQIQTVGKTEPKRPIFQSYAMHPSGAKSPSHASSGASPRRFHSDWSDPHATDIDVYCQCNCSCVYEEECRRSCDLVYGRSPSASSTRSRYGHQGFTSLPPAIQGNGRHRMTDQSDSGLREPHALHTGIGGNLHSSQNPFLRGNTVDEITNLETGRSPLEGNGVAASGLVSSANVLAMHSSRKKTGDSGETEARTKRSSRGRHNAEKGSHDEQGGSRPKVRTPKAQDVLKNEKRRPSSRNSGRHRKQTDSQGSDKQTRGRNDVRVDRNSRGRTDQVRKAVEGGMNEEWEWSRGERGQQMGNSYVVRRSGLPPPSQAYESKYETEKHRNGKEMFGAEPVVKLEYEKRSGLVQIGQKQERRRQETGGGEVSRAKRRSKQGQRRQKTNGKEGGQRPRSRPTPKHTSRSRTPILGVF